MSERFTHICRDCEWWKTNERHAEVGECRRNPPQLSQTQKGANWPMTYQMDWCGEFKLRESINDGWQ
jgi:hypothetical protein